MLGQIQILIEGVRNASNTVAHDLRTPLTELRNRLEELLRRRPPLDEAWSEVQASVGDLDRVIGVFNALLRLAEIDSGARLSGFREVRLDERGARSGRALRPRRRGEGQRAGFSAPADAVTVQGDPDLLAQAIANLVDNAVKFSPPGGKVALDVTRMADGDAEIRVTDSGPGHRRRGKGPGGAPLLSRRRGQGQNRRGAGPQRGRRRRQAAWRAARILRRRSWADRDAYLAGIAGVGCFAETGVTSARRPPLRPSAASPRLECRCAPSPSRVTSAQSTWSAPSPATSRTRSHQLVGNLAGHRLLDVDFVGLLFVGEHRDIEPVGDPAGHRLPR